MECLPDVIGTAAAADLVFELPHAAHALGVAADAAAEAVNRRSLVAVLENEVQMSLDHGQPLVAAGVWKVYAIAEFRLNLFEEPRLSKRSAGDHDSVAARLLNHRRSVCSGVNVAVSNDGNGIHSIHHRSNAFKPHLPAKHLLGCPPVHRDGGNPNLFEPSRKFWSHNATIIPPEPNLGRHRGARLRSDRFDHPLGEPHGVIDIAQQQRSAMLLGNLVDRTAHIDIDNRRAMVDGPQPGLGQGVGAVAIDLHAQRRIRFARGRQFHRLGCSSQQAVHVEQIRAGKSHPAEFPA